MINEQRALRAIGALLLYPMCVPDIAADDINSEELRQVFMSVCKYWRENPDIQLVMSKWDTVESFDLTEIQQRTDVPPTAFDSIIGKSLASI